MQILINLLLAQPLTSLYKHYSKSNLISIIITCLKHKTQTTSCLYTASIQILLPMFPRICMLLRICEQANRPITCSLIRMLRLEVTDITTRIMTELITYTSRRYTSLGTSNMLLKYTSHSYTTQDSYNIQTKLLKTSYMPHISRWPC